MVLLFLKNRISGSGTLLPTFHNYPLVYQLLNFKALSAYSYRNEVICIDGFETNKKPGNQFQNKSLKAMLFSSSIRRGSDQISSSLFNTSRLSNQSLP